MDSIGKAEADRRLNQVRAVAAGLVDHVARIVDHIGVVARATEHRVRTAPPFRMLAALLPVMVLFRALPVPLIAAVPSQRQVLDVAYGVNSIGKAEADRGLNQVRAIAAGLVDHVARIVDHIGVVARAAEHRVRTGTAIEDVRGAIAGDGVVQCVAGAVDRRLPVRRQVLDRHGVDSISEAEC